MIVESYRGFAYEDIIPEIRVRCLGSRVDYQDVSLDGC